MLKETSSLHDLNTYKVWCDPALWAAIFTMADWGVGVHVFLEVDFSRSTEMAVSYSDIMLVQEAGSQCRL